MGLLAGQENILNNGDVIVIKAHMFDTLVDHMTKHFMDRSYSRYSLQTLVRDRLRSTRIYDLYDQCNFNLNADEIEKLCNSDCVYKITTQKFIVAEYSASFVQTLENALHYYRKELDQIDENMTQLLEARMRVAEKIAAYISNSASGWSYSGILAMKESAIFLTADACSTS